MRQVEAVRIAKDKLGDTTSTELAAYIQEAFGLTIKPAFVTVLLGTLQERETLERSGREALEKLQRWKAENPEEAKKLAAAAKRREAARRRKQEAKAAETPAAPEAESPSPNEAARVIS
jgi:hypothetical protein